MFPESEDNPTHVYDKVPKSDKPSKPDTQLKNMKLITEWPYQYYYEQRLQN